MATLSHVHSLVNVMLGPLGLQLERRSGRMPDAPELPARLLSGCRVLASREQLLSLLPAQGTAAEVGVADGGFSERILEINRPSLLYLVDAWAMTRYRAGLDRVKARFAREIAAGQIRIEPGLSLAAMRNIPRSSLDWIYIDTTHDYATTRAELDLAEGLVKPGGFVAGHDFCSGNPYAALPYGVVPAVCEFCLARDWALAYLALAPNGHFSFALRRAEPAEAVG